MKTPATRRKRQSPARRAPKGTFRIVEFTNPSGTTVYRVSGWTAEGKRVRANFQTHAEAVAEQQKRETEWANVESAGQTVFTRLTPAQVNDAEAALSLVEDFGNPAFTTMAEFYRRNYRDPLKRISTNEAVKLFLAEKKSAKRRERYLKDLELELGYLKVAHGGKPVHELQKDDLVGVICADGRGPERQNNIRKDFRTFFNWCLANGYAQSNPAELVPQKTVERGEIGVLPVKKVRELIEAAAGRKKGKLVPYVALATFCAIRPDELARLSWNQIDLKEKQVTITASAAKKRGRRVVDMPENCVAWLQPHAKKKPPIRGKNWRKDFDAVKERAGFGSPAPEGASEEEKKARAHLKPWPQDVLRHTGISCHYRKHEDEGKTAAWAGNSPDMIHSHYRALVSAAEAEAFFEIRPKGARNGERRAGSKKGKGRKAGKAKPKAEGGERKPADGGAKPGNVVPMPKAA